MEANDKEKKKLLSEETVKSVVKLGEALRSIHNRLISAGWIIDGDIFIPPHEQAASQNNIKS